MDKESVLNLMTEKFIQGNIFLGQGNGMTDEEIDQKIKESSTAIQYLLSEVYDVLVANNLLK